MGRTRAALEGIQQSNLNPLLRGCRANRARQWRHCLARSALPLVLARAVDLDLRAGPYLWITKTDVYVNGADQLNRTDDGIGYTLGIGPRSRAGAKHWNRSRCRLLAV